MESPGVSVMVGGAKGLEVGVEGVGGGGLGVAREEGWEREGGREMAREGWGWGVVTVEEVGKGEGKEREVEGREVVETGEVREGEETGKGGEVVTVEEVGRETVGEDWGEAGLAEVVG